MPEQSGRSPGVDPANRETGDVALCGAVAVAQLSAPASRRVCFTAPLASRSQLEELLRALHRHPGVRTLVLCADGAAPAGEALLALWREGLDAHGRLPGSRGALSPELDAAAVEALRSGVRIEDWRGKASSELARDVAGLPVLPHARVARELATPPPRERTVFLSRRTTFPLFSASVGDAWLQLLNLVLRIGLERRVAEGARIAEALNVAVTVEAAAAEEELPDFFEFHTGDFEKYYRGFVAFSFPDDVDLESAGRLLEERLPGLASVMFNVVDGKLFASFVLRDLDVWTGWPLQATALVRLHRQVAEKTGRAAGTSVFIVQSARLDDRDWNRAWAALAEHFKRPLPLQVDPAGIFLFGNDGGKARAMLLDHDAGTIFWEEAFSDPEDLSWYIVDVMPWLLPQHIRYVGQECASLMRAIREGECYVQG